MVLALVVLAGTSAMAQTGQKTDPYFHINGSTYKLGVTANTNSSFNWTKSFADGLIGSDDSDVLTSWSGNTTNEVTITWSDDAAGEYWFDVTETDNTNACKQTIRRIYINVIDFDVHVYFSDDAGANIESNTGLMSACGAGTVANYGDVLDETNKVAFSQEISIGGTGSVKGDLTTQTGTSPYTTRYVTMEIFWNIPEAAKEKFTAPTIKSIAFDYSLALTDVNSTYVSFNGVTDAAENTFISDADGATKFTATVLYNTQWGIPDVTTAATITNVTLYENAAKGGLVYGREKDSNETAAGATNPRQNTTATQTIYSAPATSVISPTQN